ncbi:MAG: alkaline phosphatase family protein [Kiritimatiellia bacterium]
MIFPVEGFLPWTMPLGYIGPGAGFAFLGSFLILFVAVLLALFAAFSFPVRMLFRLSLARTYRQKLPTLRVIVLGMDGLDPARVLSLMARGELPNFRKLAADGMLCKLITTCPPISPVAWSSFQTGVNPGKHNVFDFLNRDLRTYLPELSSCRTHTEKAGPFGFRPRSSVTLLRKSRPFWEILGEYGVFSTVLRVPVTYPAQKFNGLLLSGMCVPDIRGTQGSFTVFETETTQPSETSTTGGVRVPVELKRNRIEARLPGPVIQNKERSVLFRIDLDPKRERAILHIGGRKIYLEKGVYSEWVRIQFGWGPGKICGVCRFLLCSVAPRFQLYVTPINIDPGLPALPISHPRYYSIYLEKLLGPYATLGLAEDTWALNEGIIDEKAYLEQVWDMQRERERMFLEALERTRTGVCCCVFDLPDRVQHMFFRDTHCMGPCGDKEGPSIVIEKAYREMDRLLGTVLEKLDARTVLFVLSDHGFVPFRRGVNINVWLKKEGYLVEKPEASARDFLRTVDWSRTRAYTFGLSGIYLNRKGRERQGIVSPAEAAAIKQEILAKLNGLKDLATGQTAVLKVYDACEMYRGPYRENGPDLIVGYAAGYRASWEAAVGRTDGPLFSDNSRCWSGDHCVDFSTVPGIFASNRRFSNPRGLPHITDIAPTILQLFGIPKPQYMDGEAMRIEAA